MDPDVTFGVPQRSDSLMLGSNSGASLLPTPLRAPAAMTHAPTAAPTAAMTHVTTPVPTAAMTAGKGPR